MNALRMGVTTIQDFVLELERSDEGVDFTQVTAQELRVQLPDGSKVTWTASKVSATEAKITLLRSVVQADLPMRGTYRVYARLSKADGSVWRSEPKAVPVKDEFEL